MDAHSACQPGARLEAKERREQRRLCYGVRSPARASRLCYPPVPRWCAPNRASPSPAGSGEQEQRSAYISGAIAEHVWVHRKVVHGERTPVVRGGADSGAARAANERPAARLSLRTTARTLPTTACAEGRRQEPGSRPAAAPPRWGQHCRGVSPPPAAAEADRACRHLPPARGRGGAQGKREKQSHPLSRRRQTSARPQSASSDPESFAPHTAKTK